ncbi:phage major capsid protein [Nonomuraea sp. NPDC023979]|uniref:phage major capsid protein n=1 Tax=Nonomuraea sp. NPDC023979 TaxID=3154796 RepID=UPI0033C2E333
MSVEAPERIVEFPALKEAQGKLDAKRKELADLLREAGPEYDMSKVKSIQGDTHAKVAHIGSLNAALEDLKKDVDEKLVIARAAGAAKDAEQVEQGGKDLPSEPRTKSGQHKSLGELFVASQACKGYRPGSGQGPSASLDIELKTLFSTGAGWAPESIRTGRVEMFPTRPAPHVVEFLPQTTTSQASVVYMEETTFTNAAQETAEGGTYQEATLALTERASQVRKVAVFLPVTDEQFEDEPRAQMYVENRLPFMLRQRLDSQALVGDGTGVNLLGTSSVVGIQVQAKGADPIPDAIYKLFTKIRDDGFAEPSVLFIRPAKWQEVRLLKTTDGVYIWGHPSIPGPSTIWGVPVVETTAAPATSAIAGDYTNFSELAVRRGIDVQVSNSHSTFFAEGKLALRADVRCALIHYRPKAFGHVTGL